MNKAAHRIYAVGDIHGEFEQLQDAISKIESDGGRDSPVVFLGDYIDRGPQSRDVIEYLIEGLEAGRNWVCLMGNHDRMFRMFMEATPRADPRLRPEYHWLHDRLGGKETLRSYGVNVANTENLQDIHHQARVAIPKTHLEFLDSLKYSLEQQKLFFVHAGIRPGVPFKEQDMDDLIWIRQEFHEDTRTHPRLVVHGHTPIPEPRHFGNRVNLDTGAGYGDSLTTAVFEGLDCWVLSSTGRSALLPQPL